MTAQTVWTISCGPSRPAALSISPIDLVPSPECIALQDCVDSPGLKRSINCQSVAALAANLSDRYGVFARTIPLQAGSLRKNERRRASNSATSVTGSARQGAELFWTFAAHNSFAKSRFHQWSIARMVARFPHPEMRTPNAITKMTRMGRKCPQITSPCDEAANPIIDSHLRTLCLSALRP